MVRKSAVPAEKGNEGETPIYRSPLTPPGKPLVSNFADTPFTSVYDFFKTGLSKTVNGKFLAERSGTKDQPGDFVWTTYQEADVMSRKVGEALVKHYNLAQHKNGAFLPNSIPFFVLDIACCAYGLVCVPLYPTYDDEAAEYILNHSEITVLFATADLLSRVVKILPNLKSLKHVIVTETDQVNSDQKSTLEKAGVSVCSWNELLQKASGTLEPSPSTGEEWYTLCFTSGTTGTPKGAILAHAGVIAHNAGVIENVFNPLALDPAKDVHFSYLPCAHVYERMVSLMMYYNAIPIGIYRGSPLHIIPDAQVLKPTIFPGVPRVLNRVCDQIRAASAREADVYKEAYEAKKSELYKTGKPRNDSEWDIKVFKKYQMSLGGNVRLILSASAPISSANLEFLRIVMGATTLEAYGSTENGGAISMTLPEDIDITIGSHVGSLNPSMELKLVDVAEMNYLSTDKPFPRGEVCVRGPAIMRGYLKNKEQTDAAIDSEGWLHSGDIGAILADGQLRIIDRKKHIFKLSQGEYVAPERIETVFARNPWVLNLFLHGDSMRNYLVAALVPNPEHVLKIAPTNGWGDNYVEIIQKPEVKELALKELNEFGKANGLHGYELPRDIVISHEPFTIENGLLTVTNKTKRNVAKDKFAPQFAKMMEEIDGKAK